MEQAEHAEYNPALTPLAAKKRQHLARAALASPLNAYTALAAAHMGEGSADTIRAGLEAAAQCVREQRDDWVSQLIALVLFLHRHPALYPADAPPEWSHTLAALGRCEENPTAAHVAACTAGYLGGWLFSGIAPDAGADDICLVNKRNLMLWLAAMADDTRALGTDEITALLALNSMAPDAEIRAGAARLLGSTPNTPFITGFPTLPADAMTLYCLSAYQPPAQPQDITLPPAASA